jgi:hypothetical protein
MATAISPVRSSESVSMRANVRPDARRFHSTRRPSAALRLAHLWGCSEKTAEMRLSGDHSVFRMSRDAIQVAVDLGQTERAGMWLDLVESPFLGTGVLPYHEAKYRAGCTDADEDRAEAEYERNPCPDTARALIAKSVADRRRAEERERALKAQWGIE